jgi:hypothetical protein
MHTFFNQQNAHIFNQQNAHFFNQQSAHIFNQQNHTFLTNKMHSFYYTIQLLSTIKLIQHVSILQWKHRQGFNCLLCYKYV